MLVGRHGNYDFYERLPLEEELRVTGKFRYAHLPILVVKKFYHYGKKVLPEIIHNNTTIIHARCRSLGIYF